MNRRSFLGLLPFAPIVGPALAKEAAADITQLFARGHAIAKVDRMFGMARARVMQPQIASLGLSVDSSELERAVATLRALPSAARGVAGAVDRVAGVAEREATALSQMQTTEDEYPSPDILPM